MPIYDRVSADLKDAMKSQDKARLNGLRGIRAAFIEAIKVDGASTLADEKAEEILRKLAKMRKESIELYTSGGRTDLVEEEQRDLAVIEAYLPKLADEATLREWIASAVAASGAATQKDLGKVMGALNGAHKGQFDGKTATTLIRALLPPA